jgi:hypothetical protein
MVVRALFLSAVPSGSWYPRLVIGPKWIAKLHNVCFWHKADILVALSNVRFWG